MARLFVAVWPPAEVVDALEHLERPVIAGVRWTTAEQWHVTLRFFGEAEVEAASDALARVSQGPVVAQAGGPARRLGASAFVVPVDGLEPIAAAVVTATAPVGRPPDDRSFRGHLTLARIKDRSRPAMPHLELARHEWPVREVTLVRSTAQRGGSHYEVVQRVALIG